MQKPRATIPILDDPAAPGADSTPNTEPAPSGDDSPSADPAASSEPDPDTTPPSGGDALVENNPAAQTVPQAGQDVDLLNGSGGGPSANGDPPTVIVNRREAELIFAAGRTTEVARSGDNVWQIKFRRFTRIGAAAGIDLNSPSPDDTLTLELGGEETRVFTSPLYVPQDPGKRAELQQVLMTQLKGLRTSLESTNTLRNKYRDDYYSTSDPGQQATAARLYQVQDQAYNWFQSQLEEVQIRLLATQQ